MATACRTTPSVTRWASFTGVSGADPTAVQAPPVIAPVPVGGATAAPGVQAVIRALSGRMRRCVRNLLYRPWIRLDGLCHAGPSLARAWPRCMCRWFDRPTMCSTPRRPAARLRPGEAHGSTAGFGASTLATATPMFVDGFDGGAARSQVAAVAGNYGLLVSRCTDHGRRVVPGTVRVVVSRNLASCPAAPTGARPPSPTGRIGPRPTLVAA